MIPPPEAAPSPPHDLATRAPLEVTLQQGTLLHRFHTATFEPIFYDRGRNGRLNAPDDLYGVSYTAKTISGAFAETFLRTPGRTLIATDLLTKKAYVSLEILRPLRLARLSGPGLAHLGATAQVVHGGKPYDVPQAWSGALHAHPRAFDGIAYNARHDDEALCYAIFNEPPPLFEKPAANPISTRTGSGTSHRSTASVSLQHDRRDHPPPCRPQPIQQ